MSGSRIWVEAWSPEYGSSYEAGGLAPTEEEVAPEVEVDPADWAPITPPESEWPPAAFLDGVSRVDARAYLDTGLLVVPGLCGSAGAGSVLVDDGKATFGPFEVRRSVVFGSGAEGSLPAVDPALVYESRSVPGDKPEELNEGLQDLRSNTENSLAVRLASDGWLVIADGPARVREPLPVVGVIKSHHKTYLGPDLGSVVRALEPGQRTPVFLFGDRSIRPRYSWYLRLPGTEGEYPWAGIARCEVYAAMPQSEAFRLADLAARHLPRFASKGFWDSRAPQNLVPIATLERRLWHLLGDRELVYRKIRSALHRDGRDRSVA